MTVPVPPKLAEHADRDGLRPWITALPTIVERLTNHWSLQVSPPFEPGGRTAWVAPARCRRFGDVVLKVAHRHDEGLDEAEGLREWDGEATVRLFDTEEVDASTIALLLERCRPGNPLAERPGELQDRVIAGLLPRLWKEPPLGSSFRPLQQMCDRWADHFEQKLAKWPVDADPALLTEGITLFRSLPASAERQVLLCTDLHAGNVLAARREPWLVIDPKPYLGDPTYDALQHLLNCKDRLSADPRGLVERFAGLLDLDRRRLALWMFARCVVESAEQPDLLAVARTLAPT
jgi:streptomycin 6-kinase